MKVDHLSFSSISSYLYCPKAWKFKYIDKNPTKTSPALLFGSAWHATVEGMVSGEIRSSGSEDFFKEDFESRVAKAEAGEGIEWNGETPATMINTAYRFLANKSIYDGIKTVKPLIDESGVAIERKIELTVPGVPVPIIGYIDVITDDRVCGDFKTSTKSWTDKQAYDSLQPMFYLAGLQQAGFEPPMKFRHYVFVKTKEPKFQMIETHYEPKRLLFIYSLIRNVWEAINRESFFENPGSWKCSSAYCEFWNLCRGRYE